MEETYDFSQHTYSINFYFDSEILYIEWSLITDMKWYTNYFIKIPSIMYNIVDKKILEWGIIKDPEDSAEEKDPNTIYVENVFLELNNIYLRGYHSNGNFKHDKKDDYLMRAMAVFLRESVKEANEKIGSNIPLHHHFSMIIPTSWGNDIRKELIYPLFVQAGLIAECDDEKRLLFFTELEALIQFMKKYQKGLHANDFFVTPKLKIGREYILYNLYFTSKKLWVNLDLLSIHYPIYTVVATEYTSTSLKSLSFSIPFNIKMKNSIQRCLQTRGFDIELAETKNILHLLEAQYHKQQFVPDLDILKDTEKHTQLCTSRPFEKFVNEWNISDAKIRSIQSMTMGDIHKDLLQSIEKELSSKLELLLNGMVYKERLSISRTTWSMDILDKSCKIKTSHGLESKMVHGFLILSKTFAEYQTSFAVNLAEIYLYSIDIIVGHRHLITAEIHLSIIKKPPIMITRYDAEDAKILSMSKFEGSAPNCIISIDLSFKRVNVSCSNQLLDTGTRIITKAYKQPLSTYFRHESLNQRPVLYITNRMKEYMDSQFKEYLELFPKYNNRLQKKKSKKNKKISGSKIKRYNQVHHIRNKVTIFRESSLDPRPVIYEAMIKALTDVGLKIKEGLASHDLDDFFEKPNIAEQCVFLDQPKYTRLFLMIYMGYLNNQVASQLQVRLKGAPSELKTGYFISVEKPLMDNVCRSKENFQKILIGSGILQTENEIIKARIVTPEEIRILPIVEKLFGLNIPLKSYFVLSRLHTTYIQLTLSQVVQIRSCEKDGSSIVIKDVSIQIEDIYDIICKHLWENIGLNGAKNECRFNSEKDSKRFNSHSIQNYTKAITELKQYLMEIFSPVNIDMDLDVFKKIETSTTCGCGIYVSVRNMIEEGLKPALQIIAAIISSSTINKNIFGIYQVDNFFVMDNTLAASKGSLFCSVFYNLLQEAIEDSIKSKRLNSQTFVIQETLHELLQPVISKTCPLYNTLMHGNLSIASEDTYAIYITNSNNVGLHIYGEGYKYNEKNYVGGKEHAMIVLRKGQLLPHTGLVKHFRWIIRNCGYFKRSPSLILNLVKLNSNYNIAKDIVSLHRHQHDLIEAFEYDICIMVPRILTLKITYRNHDSVLQFKLESVEADEEFFPIRQHLTLVNL